MSVVVDVEALVAGSKKLSVLAVEYDKAKDTLDTVTEKIRAEADKLGLKPKRRKYRRRKTVAKARRVRRVKSEVTTKRPAGTKTKKRGGQVAKIRKLADKSGKKGFTIDQAAKLGVSKQTVYAFCSNMTKKGELEKVAPGTYRKAA